MNPEAAAVRSHRTVVVSIVVASAAVTACALVGIAVMLGWIPPKASVATPVGFASPGQQVAGTAPGVDLEPGETLVSPPEAPRSQPRPMMPTYSQPPGPVPARPATAPPAAAPLPSAQPDLSPPAPLASARKRVPTLPSYVKPRDDGPCADCGSIAAITTYPDDWEVRVRFEGGATRAYRYPTPPPFRLGDRVRLEDGRLNRY
jgi:hypothetical protein